jgi:hypothetical protein
MKPMASNPWAPCRRENSRTSDSPTVNFLPLGCQPFTDSLAAGRRRDALAADAVDGDGGLGSIDGLTAQLRMKFSHECSPPSAASFRSTFG